VHITVITIERKVKMWETQPFCDPNKIASWTFKFSKGTLPGVPFGNFEVGAAHEL